MFFEYDIEQLKKVHPLPEGVVDVVYNREEIADALNKSAPMVDRYRKGGMPVLAAGGAGKSYQFQLSDCWAWFHGWKANLVVSEDQKTSQLSLLRHALVGDDGSEDMLALTPRQRREEYEAAKQYAETALAQGALIRRSEALMLVEGVFGVLRSQLVGMPDIMEREVGLTPEQSATMEKVAKELLASISDKLSKSNLTTRVDAGKKVATK